MTERDHTNLVARWYLLTNRKRRDSKPATQVAGYSGRIQPES